MFLRENAEREVIRGFTGLLSQKIMITAVSS